VLLQTSALYPGSSIGYQRSSLATEHDLVCSHAFFRVRQGGGAGARGGGAGRAPHLYAAIDGCKNPVQTEGVNKKLGPVINSRTAYSTRARMAIRSP